MPDPAPTPLSDHEITRAANARFHPGGDSLVKLLASHNIHAHLRASAESSYVEVLVFRPDLARSQAIILDHRRARLPPVELLHRCPNCSYSLAGLSTPPICPECGRDLERDRDALILADDFRPIEPAEESAAEKPRTRRSRRMYLALTVFFAVLALPLLVIGVVEKEPLFLIIVGIPAILALVAAFLMRQAR